MEAVRAEKKMEQINNSNSLIITAGLQLTLIVSVKMNVFIPSVLLGRCQTPRPGGCPQERLDSFRKRAGGAVEHQARVGACLHQRVGEAEHSGGGSHSLPKR